jgi:acyl-CoA reductase-like NAD-dependent aldehyde dehydrogenase
MAKSPPMSDRVPVRKTYKMYVNGAFVRSESGRTDDVGGENVVRGSRKDVRDAVLAARAAHEKWSGQTPANRGLVLYRLAEMLEARAGSLAEQLVSGGTVDADGAQREVEAAIDRTVWYAGWCDKYIVLASARNPVAGPHFNFSTTEPAGVVGVVAPDVPALLGLVTAALPPLVSGNAVIAVASERDPRTAVAFAECLATSDLPGGACNVLTGRRAELGPALAGHMDVNAVHAFGLDRDAERTLGELAAESVTRTRFEDAPGPAGWFAPAYDDLDRVLAFTEMKTIWHPARI